MKYYIIVFAFVIIGAKGFAQQRDKSNFKKGQFYFLWGWNRAAYTKSKIKLQGADYDFMLKHVKAHDRPTTPITLKYLIHPTIPQCNYKLGYFIRDNLAVSFGVDHMKYVMDQNQTVDMKGEIQRNGLYKGTYDGPQKLTSDFLAFEHTNGLNYINAEVEKYFLYYRSVNGKCIISGLLGAGAGILFPKTDVRLLDYEENDQFHVAGFGLSAKAGISGIFFKYLMLRLESKQGFIDMPNILLHRPGINGRGRQYFFFTEAIGSLGVLVKF